jgi:sulfate adenylyltransferase (ADP) / ATP adenylyltransferase
LKSLKNKPVVKEQDFEKGKIAEKDDPFAPPLEEELVIAHNFTEKHSLIFNKYPVTRHHVLLISKEFEHQSSPLSKLDVEACILAMKSVDNGFIFYNCGKNSGASQPHKHMQCFPESNFSTDNKLPVSHAIENYRALSKDKNSG